MDLKLDFHNSLPQTRELFASQTKHGHRRCLASADSEIGGTLNLTNNFVPTSNARCRSLTDCLVLLVTALTALQQIPNQEDWTWCVGTFFLVTGLWRADGPAPC